MFRVIASRLISAVPNLVGVVVVTFCLTRALPGDPAAFFAGPAATAESVAEVRRKLGLDRGLIEQFGRYVHDLFAGDLGNSLTTGQPVVADLVARLPASMELTLFALLFAVLLSIPIGVLAANHQDSWIDHLCRVMATACQSLPTFFLGLFLVYVFYYLLGWAPAPLGRLDIIFSAPPRVTGFYTIDGLMAGDFALVLTALGHLLLPAITLGMFAMGPLARMTRAALIAVLSSDFIRTARANGLPPRMILYRYALRNAILPIVNTLGMVFSYLLGANVLVEKVFGWPGVGSYAIDAVIASDYAPVQGFVLVMAVLYLALNLATDIVNAALDPRIEFTT